MDDAHRRQVEVPVDPLMPPPVRRIVLERDPTVVSPPSNGSGATTTTTERPSRAPVTSANRQAPAAAVQERMRIEGVWLAYGEKW
ncbi:MAG TPA: hypothetical protein VK691_02675, partial [Solirubrobacteraceae bacterium]|nr:hypothetical protein [Solirubrobacteraceae bacterium]